MSDFGVRGGGFASAPARRFHGRTPDMPITGAQATTMTGVTLTSLYLCRETSGSLVDTMGGTSLAAANGPDYARPLGPDRTGILYTAAASSHSADVNAMALASWWYAALFVIGDAGVGTLPNIVGRLTAGGIGAVIYLQPTTTLSLVVNDGIAAPLSTGSVVVNARGQIYLGQLQIDRAATTARARLSRVGGGTPDTLSGSIATFATLTAASQSFGFGAVGTVDRGNGVIWGATATGAQVEGASFLATMAQRLGVE
jgi:hypothetical protein